jgi:hypothetical protein
MVKQSPEYIKGYQGMLKYHEWAFKRKHTGEWNKGDRR